MMMETTVETLTAEVDLLTELSKDLSFDLTVIEDAKSLIQVKNKAIIDMGGSPVVIEPKDVVGLSENDLLDRITRQLKALYIFRDSESVAPKYRTLNRIFKLKSGINYEEYKKKGNKFFYGGSLGNYTSNIFSNLEATNQFFFLKESVNDAVLKYSKPDDSVLFQVVLSSGNIVFAIAYPLEKNTVLDFYQDEEATQSLNLTYSFSSKFDDDSFNNEYTEMMKLLFDAEKKYYL